MGRLATFLANMNYDNGFLGSNGIGIDADTALVVQADGSRRFWTIQRLFRHCGVNA